MPAAKRWQKSAHKLTNNKKYSKRKSFSRRKKIIKSKCAVVVTMYCCLTVVIAVLMVGRKTIITVNSFSSKDNRELSANGKW